MSLRSLSDANLLEKTQSLVRSERDYFASLAAFERGGKAIVVCGVVVFDIV